MTGYDPVPAMNRYADFSRQWVERVSSAALDTNDQISRGAFDYAEWAKSMLSLFDFGLSAALDLAPDLSKPCLPCLPGGDVEPDRSEYLDVPIGQGMRRLSPVPGSFRHVGSTDFVIPDHLITFEPSELPPLKTTYCIAVYWPDLRSGTYQGRVRVTPVEAGDAVAEVFEVTIDL